MSDVPMPSAIEGRAWTYEGVETVPEDPAALVGYPTASYAYEAFTFLCEGRNDGCAPTDADLRRMIALMAIAHGAGQRGEDRDSPELAARMVRFHARYEGGESLA